MGGADRAVIELMPNNTQSTAMTVEQIASEWDKIMETSRAGTIAIHIWQKAFGLTYASVFAH